MDKNLLIKDRIYVSDLIKKVLLSEMTVSEALKSFPKTDDRSVVASFFALAHIEADEDLRRDPQYKDEQDEYLIHISQILDKGESLPQNIIQAYEKYYTDSPIYPNMTKENILKRLKKNINL